MLNIHKFFKYFTISNFVNYNKLSFFFTNKYYFSSIISNNNNTTNDDKESKSEIIPRSELKKFVDNKDNIRKQQVKSAGKGGQHVNKTKSAVMLQDKQTKIGVKVTNSRDSFVNNGIAKKRLVDKLDLHYNGEESKIAKKIQKIQKQKAKSNKRTEQKYNNSKDDKK